MIFDRFFNFFSEIATQTNGSVKFEIRIATIVWNMFITLPNFQSQGNILVFILSFAINSKTNNILYLKTFKTKVI